MVEFPSMNRVIRTG